MAIPLRSYVSLLGRYLRTLWSRVIALAVLLLSSIGLQLAGPQILRRFIDTATGGRTLAVTNASSALALSALLYLATALAGQASALAETYVAENIGWVATNRLRADLMLHCLRLDLGFHHAHPPGELIERIDGDVSLLANFFSRLIIQVLGNALLLVGILALLFRVHWLVGAIFTGFAVLALAVLGRVQGLAAGRWSAARQASADLFGFLEERLAGAEDIRSADAAPYVVRRLLERMRDLLRKERRASLLSGILGNTLNVTFVLVTAAAFLLGAALFRAGTITLGTVYLILSYTQLLRQPIDQINRQVQDLQRAAAGVARIRALLETRSVLAEPGDEATGLAEGAKATAGAAASPLPGAPRARLRPSTRRARQPERPTQPLAEHVLPDGPLGVTLDNVSFGYHARAPVLRDLSLTIPPGTVLGVLGRTGSGKTTLARLLFRLYDPRAGVVRLGGIDLRAVPRAELTRRVGMVTQEVQLFHGTVRDNLTLFKRTIPDAAILAALRELGLERWFRALPRGLDTPLAGGGGLSAGEAQLLAFVRVFLKDPGLVILDEATARLDPATEALLGRAVGRLLAGRTAVVIAHRLGTVERADAVLILEHGRVAECGARTRLAAEPGSRFAGLLRAASAEAAV